MVADHPRPELVMHWAVEDWRLPARGVWPPGTVQAGDGAVQTPFKGGQSIKLLFPEVGCLPGCCLLLLVGGCSS